MVKDLTKNYRVDEEDEKIMAALKRRLKMNRSEIIRTVLKEKARKLGVIPA
jgi:hypothetical protein